MIEATTRRPRTLYDEALEAVAAGISVVPPFEDGSKRPITAWTMFQQHIPTAGRLRRWYADGRYAGIGVVCGAVSGNLECLDVDAADAYTLWRDTCESVGLLPIVERIEAGYLEVTPSGGRHLLYRCAEIAGNQKLARSVDGKATIETRGEGGYVVTAPSHGAVHASGQPYTRLAGSFATIVTITPHEREELHRIARALDEMPDPTPMPPMGSTKAPGEGDRPGDLYNARASWSDVLGPHGWVIVRTAGDTTYWRRPDKREGISATTNRHGNDLLWMFTSSTAFEPDKSYTKFFAYALLNHGGDLKAAARRLAADGYATERPAAGTFTVNGASSNGSTDGGGKRGENHNQKHNSVSVLPLTDLGNAERIVRQHGDAMRHCANWKAWFVWDGSRWAQDGTGEAIRRAKSTVRSIYAEAESVVDDERRKAIAKHAIGSERKSQIMAALALAESERIIAVDTDAFDADRWLLACQNGTLDLRTGQLRDHDRADLITKLAPVDYADSAECPLWLAFLDRIMAGNVHLIEFLRRAIGYSLTGLTTERVLFILHGEGRNGKSTLLEVLSAILGDYATRTPTDTILAKNQSAIPNDLAALRGSRFVTASEADEGRRLAEATIKDLTGGDTIAARFMRGEFFTFLPAFKLWFSTNHKPVIRGSDKGIWDRIRLVPFAVRIPDDEVDRELKDKLIAEGPGILAWAVKGCVAWQRDGLGLPKEVAEATADYRREMDVLGGFVVDRCIEGREAWCVVGDLYSAYHTWSDANGEKPMTSNMFSRRMTERGYRPDKANDRKKTRLWRGIGLIDSPGDPQDSDFTQQTPLETPKSADAFDDADAFGRISGDNGDVKNPRIDNQEMRPNASANANASASSDFDLSEWEDSDQ